LRLVKPQLLEVWLDSAVYHDGGAAHENDRLRRRLGHALEQHILSHEPAMRRGRRGEGAKIERAGERERIRPISASCHITTPYPEAWRYFHATALQINTLTYTLSPLPLLTPPPPRKSLHDSFFAERKTSARVYHEPRISRPSGFGFRV